MRRMGAGGGGVLSGEGIELDDAMDVIYGDEISQAEWAEGHEGKPHGTVKGKVFPRVAKWLDQIRNFFPSDVVVLLQYDAIERRGMKELLFEPEILSKVEPSVDLAASVLALKNLVPEKAKAAARDLVRRDPSAARSQARPATLAHPPPRNFDSTRRRRRCCLDSTRSNRLRHCDPDLR